MEQFADTLPEVLRVLDALKTTEKHGLTTPINWLPGDDVVIPPTISTADAKAKFGEIREVKPYVIVLSRVIESLTRVLTCHSYLRFTSLKE